MRKKKERGRKTLEQRKKNCVVQLKTGRQAGKKKKKKKKKERDKVIIPTIWKGQACSHGG